MKNNSTMLKLAKLRKKENEWESEEENPSMEKRISEQKSEVQRPQQTTQTKAEPFSWLKNTQEDTTDFFSDWKNQISNNRKEAEYRYSLSDKDRDIYDTIKNTEGYSSEYLKNRSGGDYTKKLDLEFENDEWNSLSRDQKERYLRLANASTDTDLYDSLTSEDKRLYDRINGYEHDDNGRTFLTNDDDEKNDRMYREAQNILIGGSWSDEKKGIEQKKMWLSLPADIREGLIAYSDKGGLLKSSTDTPLKDELIDTLRFKYGYSDDEIEMLFKYGAAVYNAENQQEYNELVEHELSTNPAYAFIAPFQQAGAAIASGLAAPRTLINRIANKGSYGVADPYQSYLQNVAGTGKYIGQSIQSTLEDRGDALGWLASKSYGVNMSLMESAMRVSLARGFAGAMVASNPMLSFDNLSAIAMNAMMGSSVVQQEITEMTNQGISTDQAVSTALMRGFFECLFETVSLEKIGMFSQTPILKTATKKEFLKNLVKAGFTEGMEEVSTDFANDLYDMLMNYDYSDFEDFAAQHPEWDADTLRGEYIVKKIGDYAGSFMGGAISGLGLGTITGGMAYNNVENWSKAGASVSDADYVRMASVVESIARQNASVAETLQEMADENVDDVIVKGYYKTLVDSIEQNYASAIDKAENVKELDNIMENLNRQANSVISKDIIDKYNAKIVQFGVDGKVDYDSFIQNRDANPNTTFSDLAFGKGESKIAQGIRQDVDTIANSWESIKNNPIKETNEDAIMKMAEAQGRLNENTERIEQIVRNFALTGRSLDDVEVRKYANMIGLEKAAMAFSEGKMATEETIKTSKVGTIASMSQEEINEEFGKDAANIVDYDLIRGKKNYQLAYNVGKALTNMGVNVRLYESNRNGAIPNGLYKNGTIYLDINAGVSGVNAAIGETLSHEMTHWIRANNEQGYQRLLAFVKNELGEEEFKKQTEKELAKLKKNPTTDVAEEEVVANACTKMLKNSETFKRYAIADMTGAQKIYAKLKQFINLIKSAFKGSLHEEAAALINDMETLQKEWEKALQEAIGEVTAMEGGIDTEAFEDTAVRDSVRYVLNEQQRERVSKMLQEKLGVDKATADKYIADEQSIASMIFDNIGFLDYKPDDRYEAIKKNSDYPQGTVDMTNLCRKRAIFTQIFDSLQKAFPGKLFNAMDIAEIRQVLKDNGYEVACALCFVEDRRQRVGEIAENFIERLKASNGQTLTVVNSKGETKELFMTKDLANTEVARKAGFKYKDAIKVTDKYIPTQYDLVTYEGFKALSENHPQVAAAFTRANNYLGMSSARLVEGRAEYKREILSYTPAQVKRINNKGGLRIFSFSDFEAVHLLDICQVITDAAAVGLKIQAYTKVPAFAKLVANTGIKLNRSLIASGKGFKVMPDGSKVLTYDTHEGININDPDFFDSSDNPNIGNILVGISDEHIRLAMLDDFVDYIIPFHSNQGKNVLAVKGISHWTNYKEYQRERYADGRKGARDVNIYTQVIDKYHPTNKVEFVEAFLQECEKQGKIPRFDQFLDKDEIGKYVYTPGYEKLLLDFKLFDKEGFILPQMEVNPNIDMDTARKVLNNEVESGAKRETVSKKIVNELEKKYEVRNSLRTFMTDYDNNMGLRDIITSSVDADFTTYRNFYNQYQSGVANKNTAHSNTIAVFKEIKSRPSGKPDFRSFASDKVSKKIMVSSEYWYTKDGMIRGSNHWGKIATSDWYLDGQTASMTGKIQYGFAPWSEFTHKFTVSATYEDYYINPESGVYVSTFDSLENDIRQKEQEKEALRNTTSSNGIRLSMTDAEREKALENVTIEVAEYDKKADSFIKSNKSDLSSSIHKIVKEVIRRAGKQFGAFNTYKNDDYGVDFSLSGNTIDRSVDYGITDAEQITKLLPSVSYAVKNAVAIEAHENTQYNDPNTSICLEMLGGYIDDDMFIPVRFEVKKDVSGKKNISVVIDSEGIEKDEVIIPRIQSIGGTRSSTSDVSIAEVFKNVNNKDLLVFAPDGFLSADRKKNKQAAVSAMVNEINNENDKIYNGYLDSGNMHAAKTMLKNAAEAHGFIVDGSVARLKANPSIVKSMDPETFDDNGKRIPLSKRFDVSTMDKRYSQRNTDQRVSDMSETERDNKYMDALKRHDYEEMDRIIKQAAEDNGYIPVIRFHQTGETFTKFNTDNPQAGALDSETPNGIFLKTNDHDIGVGGDYVKTGKGGNIQMPLYIKSDNMLHFKNREEAANWYKENIPGYKELSDEWARVYDEKYKPQFDELEKEQFNPDTTDERQEELDAIETELIKELGEEENKYRKQMRELLDEYFLNGNSEYDGIELEDDGHRYINGKREDVHTFIVFNPSQVKSAEIITRDDNGEIIPPSQRFNDEETDIRYSPRDIAKSESEMIVDALSLADDSVTKQSIQAYAKEYNNLKAMENESIKLAKSLKNASPSERDAITKKILRLDRQILKATEKLTEMRTQRVLTDVLVNEWAKRMADVEWTNELTYQKTKQALEQRYGRTIRDLRQKNKDIRVSQKVKDRKKSIERKAKDLMKRLTNPTDKKHIPAVLVEPTAELLNALDFWTPNSEKGDMKFTMKGESLRQKFSDFRSAIQKYWKTAQEGEAEIEYMFDQEFFDEIDELEDMLPKNSEGGLDAINDMTLEQLEMLDRTLTQLNHLISRGNKMIVQSHYDSLEDAQAATAETMLKKKDVKKTAGSIYNRLNAAQADFYAFLRYAGDGTAQIGDALSKAFEAKEWQVKEAVEFTDELLKDHRKEVAKWSKDTHEFTLSSGKKIELSTSQMMEIYLLSKREQARKHILSELGGKGIHIQNKKGKFVKAVKVNETDIANIVSEIPSEAKHIADELQKFVATVSTGWGNKASNLLYGYSKFTEENYWQIRSAEEALPDNATSEAKTQASVTKLQNMGRAKAVKQTANNAIYIGDVFDTFSKTIDEMSSYGSVLPAVTDAMRWWNSTIVNEEGERERIKSLIARKMGRDMANVFLDNIRALNGGVLGDSGSNTFLDRVMKYMMGKAKAAAVAANMRVVLQQPTAIERALAVIEQKYLAKAMLMKPATKEAQEHSPIAWHKAQGFYSNGLAPSLRQLIVGDATAGEKITEKALWLAGKADDITWGILYNAAMLKVKDTTNLKEGTKEFYDAANDIFSDIINNTQVVDTPLTKSMAMRSGRLMFFTAFMAEPVKTYNMVMTAIDKIVQDPKNAKNWTKAMYVGLYVFTMTQFINALAQSIADAARDEKDKASYFERYLKYLKENFIDNMKPWTYIPIIKDLAGIKSRYQNNNIALQAAQNVGYAIDEINKVVHGKSKKTLYGSAETIAKAYSYATGVPVSSMMRTFRSLANVAGIDLIRRDKYTNDELARNICLSLEEGDTKGAEQYRKELEAGIRKSEGYKSQKAEYEKKKKKNIPELMDAYVENQIENKMASYLAENSEEVDEWAEKYIDKATDLQKAVDEMSDRYSTDVIVKAIRKSVNAEGEEDVGSAQTKLNTIYNSKDINRMIEKGNLSEAQKVIDDINRAYAEKKSQSTAKSLVSGYWKEIYQDASESERNEIEKNLLQLKNKGEQMFDERDFYDWTKEYTNKELQENIVNALENGDKAAATKYQKQLEEYITMSDGYESQRAEYELKGVEDIPQKMQEYVSKKVDSMVADYLADNSEEIDRWAEKYIEDASSLIDAVKAMSGKYSEDVILSAIRKSVNKETSTTVSTTRAAGTMYNTGDINRMLQSGKIAEAQKIINEMADGYAKTGSKSTPKGSITEYWKPIYMKASLQEKEDIRKMLYKLSWNGKQMFTADDFKTWAK